MGAKNSQGDVARATAYAVDSESANSKDTELGRRWVMDFRTKYSKYR